MQKNLSKKEKDFLKAKSFKICYGWSEQKTFKALLQPVCIKKCGPKFVRTHTYTHTHIHTDRFHRYIVVRLD